MYDVINAREAELMEYIKINNEEKAYLNNRAKNAETELDQVKRENKRLEEENKKLKEKQKVLDKENCKLIDENVKLKKWIYQNVHGGPRIDYQEFCKKNGI